MDTLWPQVSGAYQQHLHEVSDIQAAAPACDGGV